MKIKKIIIRTFIILTFALLMSCAKNNESSSKSISVYEKIKESGVINIAMEGTWSPWTYHDENDKLVGFDTEIGEEIAKRMGVKANFIEGEWDGLLAGLSSGRYDIMINGVDITPERKQAYDFSIPYAYMKTAIIVSKDNDVIKGFSDLKGKNTANTISSTYAELAESFGANVVGVDDLNQTFELLTQKRIDATLNAEVTFYDYMKSHPDADIKIAALSDDANLVGIPIKKGNDDLVTAINNILTEMQNDGTLKSISEKYFGVDVTKPSQATNANVMNNNIEEELKMKFYIDNEEVEVEWENNDSIKQISEMARGSNVVVNAHRYGGFEQVGELGQSIVSSNVQMTTEPGDIVLYSGNNIVVFFGNNSWSYTKLGKIKNKTKTELNQLLNKANVTFTFTVK